MRYSVPLCGLLASIALASDVHDLKKDTFKGFIEEHDLVLAECEYPSPGASSCWWSGSF